MIGFREYLLVCLLVYLPVVAIAGGISKLLCTPPKEPWNVEFFEQPQVSKVALNGNDEVPGEVFYLTVAD